MHLSSFNADYVSHILPYYQKNPNNRLQQKYPYTLRLPSPWQCVKHFSTLFKKGTLIRQYLLYLHFSTSLILLSISFSHPFISSPTASLIASHFGLPKHSPQLCYKHFIDHFPCRFYRLCHSFPPCYKTYKSPKSNSGMSSRIEWVQEALDHLRQSSSLQVSTSWRRNW